MRGGEGKKEPPGELRPINVFVYMYGGSCCSQTTTAVCFLALLLVVIQL